MSRPIVLIAEEFEGTIRKGSMQALGEAKRVAAATGGTLRVLAVGEKKDSSSADLAANGAAAVEFITADENTMRNSSALAAMLHQAVGGGDALVFLSMTDLAADVAPRLATRLGVAYISDATAVDASGSLKFTRPIYAGKALESVELLSNGAVVTLRANAFPTPEASANGAAQVVELSPAKPADLKAIVREIVHKSGLDSVSLTEADIIVSGGIGVGGPEGYEPLKALCKVLGAALGASRAAVHAGWITPDHQVGQTGKTVSPNLYIACGISGAIQHQAGMRTSRCIVAINTDPNAPIFQIAHYGIVGDVKTVVPMLTEEFGRILAK
jgi:electron transfer flavoprotein alpha subunit